MQITHNTNGDGLPLYPNDLQVKTVNVYMHDSGMVCTHDYSCPVCRENHAVLDGGTGLMAPCRVCEKDYKIVKIDKRNWFQKLIGFEGVKS
jgi:hypothetical protein